MQLPLLSLITWLPMVSALVALLCPSRRKNVFRIIALVTLLLQGMCWLWMLNYLHRPGVWESSTSSSWFYFVEKFSWMDFSLGSLGRLSVNYFLGVDGLNIGLLGLALIVLCIGAIASWSIQKYVKAYFILYLVLNTLIIGSLLALDLLLFYIFFEMTLVPVYFLIGLWGGSQAPPAATKFFVYTLLGTILILLVVVGLGVSAYDPIATGIQAGVLDMPLYGKWAESIDLIQQMVQNNQIAASDMVHTFDISLMADTKNFMPNTGFAITHSPLTSGYSMRKLGFLLLLFGFLIKLGAVPLHSWLPDAHVQAPTPISIVLAGILLKLGGYGLLRTAYSIFPAEAVYYGFWIGVLGIVSSIYAGLNALAMQDLKKMIAYASIAHMGFFLLGIGSLTVEGIQGALYQLISHGLIVSLLFLIVDVLYIRTHDRTIDNYKGLAAPMPYYTVLSLLAFAAALGLPGFSSFIAELLILLGVFQSSIYCTALPFGMGIVGGIGILLNATYYVWTIQRMFGGSFSLQFPAWKPYLKDLHMRESILLLFVIIIIGLLGIFPNLLIALTKHTIIHFVDRVYEIGRAHLQP